VHCVCILTTINVVVVLGLATWHPSLDRQVLGPAICHTYSANNNNNNNIQTCKAPYAKLQRRYLNHSHTCLMLICFTDFLPRDASAERGNAIVSRPSVCPSVCL